MPSRPWYKWFPADFLADTRMLSLEEQGAYRALLDAIWLNGPIPDKARFRARLLNLHGHSERRLWTVLRPFFVCQNGRIDHPKIAAQMAESRAAVDSARKAGRKGGLANAVATRARARGGSNARAEPDPDKDLERFNALPLCQDSRARAREAPASAAADLQRELEQKRASLGIETESIGSRSVAAIAAGVGASKDKA